MYRLVVHCIEAAAAAAAHKARTTLCIYARRVCTRTLYIATYRHTRIVQGILGPPAAAAVWRDFIAYGRDLHNIKIECVCVCALARCGCLCVCEYECFMTCIHVYMFLAVHKRKMHIQSINDVAKACTRARARIAIVYVCRAAFNAIK